MSEIEEVEKVEEEKKPKDLKDIMERYGAAQNELIEVLVTMFVKLDTVEKKLSNPLLSKLLE
jgi:archaellum component FlaC